jgi:hypothetical protein
MLKIYRNTFIPGPGRIKKKPAKRLNLIPQHIDAFCLNPS